MKITEGARAQICRRCGHPLNIHTKAELATASPKEKQTIVQMECWAKGCKFKVCELE